jgi:hypothetical protein
MTWIIDTSKRRLSAKLAAGIALSALLALGTVAAPANARDRDGENRGDWNGGYYNGGYYNAPPVVYGSSYGSSYYGNSPYYYPPPVVYGPGVGLSLPFVNLNIR